MALNLCSLAISSGWVALCLALVEYWEVQPIDRDLILFGDPSMPAAGDKRLVQVSAGRGYEVMLLRRSNEAGYWLVADPEQKIYRLKIGDRQFVRTSSQGPKTGVMYQPLPVLTPAQRQDLMRQSQELAGGNTAGVEILGYHWSRMAFRRSLGLACTLPVWGLRLLRWSAKSPIRILGFMGLLFLTEETLRGIGLFQLIYERVDRGYGAVMEVWLSAVEASESLSEWWKTFQAIMETIAGYIDPWKIPLWIGAVYLVYRYGREFDQSNTPLATPGSTPGGSGESTPTEDDKVGALKGVAATMDVQKALLEKLVLKLEDLAAQQQALGGRLSDRLMKEREESVVEKERFRAQQDELQQNQRKTWDALGSRLDMFERVLREDKGDAAGGPSSVKKTAAKEVVKTGSDQSKVEEVVQSDKDPSLAILVKKLQKDSKTPQEKFLEALDHFVEVDPEMWATYFPPGFRQRMSPHSLGEVYASGNTGKEWAKKWVNECELGDCDEAREIIPTAAALDAIFLVDQVPGAINQVGTEKLVRKMFGIRQAFRNVKKAADWKKGKGNNSKVDYEAWKRIDPGMQEDEHIFVNRRVEDEQRSEMERDASWIKAKAKLAEAGKKGKS